MAAVTRGTAAPKEEKPQMSKKVGKLLANTRSGMIHKLHDHDQYKTLCPYVRSTAGSHYKWLTMAEYEAGGEGVAG